MDAEAVLSSLDGLCGELRPGDLFPPHQELMKRLDASERAVRWALDELRRQGKIVRRQGAGTFVAELKPEPAQSEVSNGAGSLLPSTMSDAGTIVAIATPDHGYYDLAMKLLFHQAEAAGFGVAYRLVDAAASRLPALPKLKDGPLGFIVFRFDLAPLAQQLQQAGHRVVLMGAPLVDQELGVPNVYGDHEVGGYLATKHLIDLGHRRIGYIGDVKTQRTLRWQGHLRAIRESRRCGHDVSDAFIPLKEMLAWKTDLARGREYLSQSDAPTGLVGWNDQEALVLLGLLSRMGLRVPEDISVVGYDNLPESEWGHPSLTTVNGGVDQQLRGALNVLTRAAPVSPHYNLVVVPTLIARESSGSHAG